MRTLVTFIVFAAFSITGAQATGLEPVGSGVAAVSLAPVGQSTESVTLAPVGSVIGR